uniref:SFRICE_024390 n=1 Tax=Spodoptera frugiperda TaxID=7108 RepID=A0A2H1WN94_SPOFR
MIHGPCGEHNLSSPCMKKEPRQYVTDTQIGQDGYPVYCRRDAENGGQITTVNIRGRPTTIDNRWIAPYSPMLCRLFNAHINVEYCHSVKAIKYLCKYINKGSDQATFSVRNPHYEVENYLNAAHPTVVHLVVHLENGQRVYTPGTALQVAHNRRKTTLLAFFELCNIDEFVNTLFYHEVPHYFTWADNKFSRRRCSQDVDGYPDIKRNEALGRVYGVHPSQSECFYLRMLLHHVREPSSFENLKTVNGVVKEKTLREASTSQCSLKLRELFVILTVCYKPHGARDLSNECKTEEIGSCVLEDEGLIQIENKLLALNDKTLSDFGLPSPVRPVNNAIDIMLVNPHNISELATFVNENLPKLVTDQKQAFNPIIYSVTYNKGNIFLDASGATRKTFVFAVAYICINEINNLILQKVPGQGKTYKSIDTVCNIEETVHHPQEFLNSLKPSGLQAHELLLKNGTHIMLLRNLSPSNLCNGTRLLIKDLKDNIIVASILNGPVAGQLAHIPRIPMILTDLPISDKHSPWLALTYDKNVFLTDNYYMDLFVNSAAINSTARSSWEDLNLPIISLCISTFTMRSSRPG